MTSKESALLALMQEQGYSLGIISVSLHFLATSREAIDDMILFIDDYHPTEEEVSEHLAELCKNYRLA